MKLFCPYCEEETEQELVREIQDFEIRSKTIPVEVTYYHCINCGNDYEFPQSLEEDPFNIAYRSYREKSRLLQPEEIRAFRTNLGLTQKEFSEILGIGIATLNRYENGALQSEAHDNIIRLYMDPDILIKILKAKPHLLSQQRKERMWSLLQADKEESKDYMNEFIKKFKNHPPDVSNGNKFFDFYKFTQVCKYFCFKNEIYKTKLLKLIFYADFKHYKDFNTSITGSQYAHLAFGPVPDQYDTLLVAVSSWLKEVEKKEQVSGDYVGEVFTTQSQPDMTAFTKSELDTLNYISVNLSHLNSKQLSNLVHKEKAYLETNHLDIIPYTYAEDLSL